MFAMAEKKPLYVVGGVLAIVLGILLVTLMAVYLGNNFLTWSLGGAILGGTIVGGLVAIYQGATGKEVQMGRI